MHEKLLGAVRKAKQGDSEASTELYNLTERMVYFTALKITGNEDDALDIVQETYIKIFSELSNLHNDEAFISWVKQIVVNLSKDHMKKRRPVLFETDEEEERIINSIPEISEDFLPEHYADRRETSRIVMKIVDSLPEAQRMTVILYYYDGLTVGEVAEYMEVSEGTVKSRLNYARKQIKDEVEKLEKEGTKLYAIPVFMLSRILENASLDYTLPQSVADRILADALLMASDAAVSGATVGAGAATGAEVAGSMSAATGAGATTGASVATGAVVAASTKTGLLASLAALSITAKIIIIAAAAAIIAAGVIIGVVTSGTGESGDATPPPSGTNENSESASTVPSVTGDGAVFGSDAPDDIIEITLTPGIEPLSFAEYARLFYEYVQQKHVGQDGFLDAEIIDVGRDMPLFFTAYRNDQVPITLYEYKDGSFTVTHLQGLYPGFDPGDAITDVGFFSDGGDVYWISYIQEPQGTINFQAQNLSDISDTFAVLYFPPENYPGRNSQIELFPTNMTGGFLSFLRGLNMKER